MLAVILALLTTASFGAAVAGWRQIRTTGFEALELALGEQSEPEAPMPIMTRVIDGLGTGSQRLLLRAYGPRRRIRLDQRLERAGRPEGLTDRSFLRRQAGYTVIGVILLLMLGLLGHWILGAVLLIVCFMWMVVWLRRVGRGRQREIARELPDFLDVVAVTVSAGLGLQSALERVTDGMHTPLGQEIQKMLDDLRYGLGRRAALNGLRDRNDVPSLGTFVTAMLQAEELGTPPAQALMDIAAEVRRQSAQAARQTAAKAGPKVSLVVSTTIVPGAMLLIGASLVLANLPKFRGIFG